MWGIAKGVLWLLDGFFDVIDKIWRYKFFDNEYVGKIFIGAITVAGTWLILKIMIELVLNHIVKNDSNESPLTIYRGVMLAIVMMFLITPLFDFGHKVSTAMTDAVISTSSMNSKKGSTEGTISKALIRAMVYENQMDKDDIDYLVKNWKTVDITKGEGGLAGIGDVYTYSVNLFMLVVLSILTVFLLFFVAIQIAKRVMEIALYKIIGPFCCTGLTNSQSKSFETWAKSTMGLFLITVVQFVCLGLLINMFGTAIQDNGTMAGVFLIIGALLFIITTPTIVSSLLGQQSGLMTAFGDMQSMMAIGHGVSAGLSVAGSGLAGTASVASGAVGHMAGIGQQFHNYKNEGSSTVGAIGKTLMSEAVKPFSSSYNKAHEFMKGGFDKGYSRGAASFSIHGNDSTSRSNDFQFNTVNNQYTQNSGTEDNGGWK